MTWIKSSFSRESGCIECDISGADWRKAPRSFANGNCVEIACADGAAFAKASASVQDTCVEAACTDGAQFARASTSTAQGQCAETTAAAGEVLVRDSKDVQGPHLHFPAAGWEDGAGLTFTSVDTADVPEHLTEARIATGHAPGEEEWYSLTDGTDTLWFTQAEVDAFRSGVRMREFALA